MIRNYLIETKLGLRYYGGGGSSGSNSSSPQLSPDQMLAIYNSSLPSAMSTMNAQVAPTTTATANAAAGANPIYTANVAQQLGQYAPYYSAMGNVLSNQQANATANMLGGSAGNAAATAVGLNNALNPTQAASNAQAQNLLGSINLNGLSPGEYNATERSLNQSNAASGNLGINNGTNSIANAMNFGGAFNNKLNTLNTALGTATNVANAQNSQVNPYTAATNSMNTGNNFGLSQFNPTQANSTTSTPFSFASSFGNQLAGVSAAQRSSGSTGSANVSLCYLTTACCEHKGLPDNCEELTVLRRFRDEHVPLHLVKQYYETAPAIAQRIRGSARELEYVYSVVTRCVDLIKRGVLDEAIVEYKNMVITLHTA